MLKLPPRTLKPREDAGELPIRFDGTYAHGGADVLASIKEETVGNDGMATVTVASYDSVAFTAADKLS